MTGRLKLAMAILFAKKPVKKDPVKVEAAKESARVTALKRQVETLEEINIAYAEQVKLMSKELSKQKEGDMQEKIIGMVGNMFLGNQSMTPNSASSIPVIPQKAVKEHQSTLETGVRYSDSDLMSMAENIPSPIIQQLKNMAFDKFSEVIKTQLPDISNESIQRSKEILEAMP